MGILSNLLNLFIVFIFILFISFCKYYNKDKNDFSIPDFFKDEIIFLLETKNIKNININDINDYFLNRQYVLNINDFQSEKILFDDAEIKYTLDGSKTELYIKNLKISDISDSKTTSTDFNLHDLRNFNIHIDKINIEDKKININLDELSFNNNILKATTKSINARAEIINDEISINIEGKYQDIYELTKDIGYYEYIDYLGKDWIVEEDIEVNIRLDNKTKTLNKIDIVFKNNNINFTDIKNLQIDNINGVISINTKDNYSLNGEFTGIIFGEFIKSTIKNQEVGVKITSNGKVDIDKLNQWLDINILNHVHGKNNVDFELFLGENNNSLHVKSNLFEVHSDLPEPFYKDNKRDFPIDLKYNIDNHSLKVKLLNHKLDINDNGFIINLNGSDKTTEKQYGLFGTIPSLNTKRLINLFKNQDSKEKKIKEIVFNSDIDLSVNNIVHNDEEYGELKLLSKINSSDDVMFSISSEYLEGNFLVSKDLSYIGDIKKLHLDIGKSDNVNIDLHDFKNGKLKVENLYINNNKFYDLNISIPKNEEDILNIQVTSNAEDYFIGSSISHSKIDGLTRFTSLEENLIAGNDIYSLNKWNNEESPVTTKKFFINSNLYWTGQPLDFNKESLRGTLEIDLSDITLKGVAEDYSKMKVLNIFNFDNLFRFFMFDFKNISNKELYFDNFNLQGNDAKIKGSGNIDIIEENIDAKIKIQIPVTNKMPVLTLLAGASPQTAGIIFLADKIFGEKIDRAFDVNINLTGDLSDIKVDKK